MMHEWIKLDPEKLNKPKLETIQGVEVEVMLSPYDVPDAVGGNYDKERKRFVIEFKYASGDEPRSVEWHDQYVNFIVGRNSQRLYGLEIDVDAMNAHAVSLKVLEEKVDKAIDDLGRKLTRRSRLGNYGLAKEVISQSGRQLFGTLVRT